MIIKMYQPVGKHLILQRGCVVDLPKERWELIKARYRNKLQRKWVPVNSLDIKIVCLWAGA